MVLIDYVIIVIFFLSVMVGFFRGLTLEFLSLVSWVFSFWAAFYFMEFLEVFYRPYIEFSFLRAICFHSWKHVSHRFPLSYS